jgi:hypothetical protein
MTVAVLLDRVSPPGEGSDAKGEPGRRGDFDEIDEAIDG